MATSESEINKWPRLCLFPFVIHGEHPVINGYQLTAYARANYVCSDCIVSPELSRVERMKVKDGINNVLTTMWTGERERKPFEWAARE